MAIKIASFSIDLLVQGERKIPLQLMNKNKNLILCINYFFYKPQYLIKKRKNSLHTPGLFFTPQFPILPLNKNFGLCFPKFF
jgi:hypothetical protein